MKFELSAQSASIAVSARAVASVRFIASSACCSMGNVANAVAIIAMGNVANGGCGGGVSLG